MNIKQFLDTEGARHLAERVQNIVKNKTYTFASITDKPTTLEGYGIIDGVKRNELGNYASEEILEQNYVKKEVLNSYVRNSELGAFATRNDLTDYVTKEELEKMLNPEVVSNAEEIAAVLNGEDTAAQMKIEEDLTVSNHIIIPADKEVTLEIAEGTTLNLGNKTLASNGKLVIKGEATIQSTGSTVMAQNGGEVIVEGGNVISTNSNAIVATKGGTVTMNDGYVQAQEVGILTTFQDSTINFNGGTINTIDNFGIGGNGTLNANADQGGTIINITGGRIEGHITSPGYVACGIYLPNHGVCNISGGEIVAIGGCGVCLRAGTLNVTGGFISGSGDSSLLGKVGDSRVVVGPNGIIYDQKAHYPGAATSIEDGGIHLNIYSGTITGKNSSVQVIRDDNYEPDINVNGGLLMPAYVPGDYTN